MYPSQSLPLPMVEAVFPMLPSHFLDTEEVFASEFRGYPSCTLHAHMHRMAVLCFADWVALLVL